VQFHGSLEISEPHFLQFGVFDGVVNEQNQRELICIVKLSGHLGLEESPGLGPLGCRDPVEVL